MSASLQRRYKELRRAAGTGQTVLRKLAWAMSEGEFIAAVTDGGIDVGAGVIPLSAAEIVVLREARTYYEDRAWGRLGNRARSDGMVRALADDARRHGVCEVDIPGWVQDRVHDWIADELTTNPWPWGPDSTASG